MTDPGDHDADLADHDADPGDHVTDPRDHDEPDSLITMRRSA
jgi:hypothetical protein